MSAIVVSGRGLNAGSPNFKFRFAANLDARVLVDVGAASGHTTARFARESPGCRVHAFEPFPGNWPFLEESVAGVENVSLHLAAASESNATATFFVPAVVTGAEAGWTEMAGYSSGGRLVGDVAETSDPRLMTVDTVRLDSEISEDVDFLKIDVQGSELSVLKGAAGIAARRGLACIYLEYGGQPELLEWLVEHDYLIVHDAFFVCPREESADLSEWELVSSTNMSNGHVGWTAWSGESTMKIRDFQEFITRPRPGIRLVQTDLLCIHRTWMERGLDALSRCR